MQKMQPELGESRASFMARVAAAYIREFYPSGKIFYDDAKCDGYCVADDLEIADLGDIVAGDADKLAKISAAVERCQQNDRDGMPITMAAQQLYIELCGIFEMPF